MQILDSGVTVLDFVCHSDHLPNCDSSAVYKCCVSFSQKTRCRHERFVSTYTNSTLLYFVTMWLNCSNTMLILYCYIIYHYQKKSELGPFYYRWYKRSQYDTLCNFYGDWHPEPQFSCKQLHPNGLYVIVGREWLNYMMKSAVCNYFN